MRADEVGVERAFERRRQEGGVLELRERTEQPHLLLFQSRFPLKLPHGVVHVAVALLRGEAENDFADIGVHLALVVRVLAEPAARLGERVGVSVASQSGQHGAPQQRVEVSLARLRVPADARARRPEQLSPEASVRFEERLVRQEVVQRAEVRAEIAPHVGVVLVHVGLGDFEEVRRRLDARLRQRVGVALDAQAVDGRQVEALDGRSQQREVVAPVLHAEEARLLRVDLHPVVRPAIHAQARGAFPLERGRRLVALRRPCAERHVPERVVLPRVVDDGVVDEAALVYRDGDTRFPSFDLRVEVRVARLVQPRVHHLRDRLARRRRQCVPEVARVGIVVAVLDEVVVESFSKTLGAEEVFEHPQHGAALAVADRVEELSDLGGVLDLLVDGVRVLQAVEAEGASGVLRHEARPRIPLREEMVDRLVAHPRREALVQPKRVPPRHRYEVPEPLVRHLVRDNARHDLLRARRGVLGVDEYGNLAVGYRAPVLHRARREVGYGDVVHLFERVRDAEVLV